LTSPVMAGGTTTSTKRVTSHDAGQVLTRTATQRSGVVLRQDLFDRNNPNNLRSDWPAPPAQPGQH
jgi:hypothetical protein